MNVDEILESPDQVRLPDGQEMVWGDDIAWCFFVRGAGGAISHSPGEIHYELWKRWCIETKGMDFTDEKMQAQFASPEVKKEGYIVLPHGRFWVLNKPIISVWGTFAETIEHVPAILNIVALKSRHGQNSLWEFEDSMRDTADGVPVLMTLDDIRRGGGNALGGKPQGKDVVRFNSRRVGRNQAIADKEAEAEAQAFVKKGKWHSLDPIQKARMKKAGRSPIPTPDTDPEDLRGFASAAEKRFRNRFGDSLDPDRAAYLAHRAKKKSLLDELLPDPGV